MKINLENSKLQKNPFKIPHEYFNTIEDIVLARLKAEAMTKENTSSIPKDYFDAFENTVLSELKHTKPKVISLKSKISKIIAPIAIAASLLLIFVLSTNKQQHSFEDLTSSDIEQWFENENITFDDYELAMVIDDDDLADFEHSSAYSKDELLDYLIETDIDFINFEN